jgi:hypothetical protein
LGELWGWGALCFAFGALLGISEIISRYRDEPLEATLNWYGAGYLALNGLMAIGAYALLVRYAEQLLPAVAGDLVLTSIVAGFGAMAILRSKFFIFRGDEGQEYPIGPAIVLETILHMLDRQIDRMRASDRQRRVFGTMRDIDDFNAVADFLLASLLGFQNLSLEEKQKIADVVKEYQAEQRWPGKLKTMGLGFMFLTIAGERNFDQVVRDLKEYLKTPTPEADPVI